MTVTPNQDVLTRTPPTSPLLPNWRLPCFYGALPLPENFVLFKAKSAGENLYSFRNCLSEEFPVVRICAVSRCECVEVVTADTGHQKGSGGGQNAHEFSEMLLATFGHGVGKECQ